MQVYRQKLLGAQNWDLLLDMLQVKDWRNFTCWCSTWVEFERCKALEEDSVELSSCLPGTGNGGDFGIPGLSLALLLVVWMCRMTLWVLFKEVMMAQLSSLHCCCRCWGRCDGIFQIRDRRQKTVTTGHLNNTELERTERFLKIEEDGWALMSSSAHPNCSLVFLLLCNVVSLCPTLRMHLTAIYSCQILQLSWAVFIKDKPEGVVLVGSKGQAVVG